MKTLTYGILPSFDEIDLAFTDLYPEPTPGETLYRVELNPRDYEYLEMLGLLRNTTATGPAMGGKNYADYNSKQLYAVLKRLVALNTPVGITRLGVSKVEWAMDFASSILTTLGFEWV